MATRTSIEKDYYATLGIDAAAGPEEIRKAYRRLALQWHPDRNPGDPRATSRFQEISEAYAVLIDPEKRRQYDLGRDSGFQGGFPFNRDDLFRDMFTNPFSSPVFEELAREFERMGMRVDRFYFQNALFGGRAFVMGGIFVISPLTPLLGLYKLARSALGKTAAAEKVPGREDAGALSPAGFFSGLLKIGRRLLEIPAMVLSAPAAPRSEDLELMLALAPEEAERGVRKPLVIGSGAGREEIVVRIPAGVKPGNRLRIRGKGRPAPGGLRGDLYLMIEVRPPASEFDKGRGRP